ncbi:MULTISPECIES: hypothetical protein [unclassified Microbacterium]|uniref:hypothetical protein n=1 Tax=unclassified Microbacterium TaxID=2609290 RepID=UPI00109C7BCB|nr:MULTISPECIES: hypothetical protein [unclassified Microbacterium]
MRASWWQAIGVVAVCSAILGGCAFLAERPGQESKETADKAKADAQAMELEIASLIPDDVVASVDQKPDGTLFSCDEARHHWAGSTTVVLVSEADATEVVKQLESDVRDEGRFSVESWVDVTDTYSVQLTLPGSVENYIFSEGEPHTIRIASGSEYFTLPEGVYQGGTF